MNFESPIVRKIGSAFLGALILTYIIYQVFIINYSSVTTETALYTQIEDTIDVSAWFVRDETVISTSYSGVTSFVIEDGKKVAKGDVIAEVYTSNGDASIQRQIELLEAEINNLEKLVNSEEQYSTDSNLLGTQINSEILELNLSLSSGDLDSISDYRSELQYLISKKRIATGQEDSSTYSARIDELNAEKEEIEDSLAGAVSYITSPNSGYFVSYTDGYESSFDFDNIGDISVSDLENVSQNSYINEDNTKVAQGFTWYLCAIIDEQDKIKIESESSVTLNVPNADVEDISMTVVSINKDEESGNYALVLSCNYNSAEIMTMRYETVEIVVNTYSGVLVNQSAIYFEDIEETVVDEDGNTEIIVHENVMGIYVKYAGQLSFVQVFSDIKINNYLVCKVSLSTTEKSLLYTSSTIEIFDEIVIGGSDLYDGKIV